MKILYDHLAFMEKYGGVSRYFSKMISCLPSEVETNIAVKFSSNEYLSEIKTNHYFHFIEQDFPHKDRFYSLLNKPNSIKYIKNGDYDIYHMTHVDPYGFKYTPKNKKKVMTIHDLNLYKLPGIVRDNFSLKVWQKKSAELADSIITVSENTKKDMIDMWHIPEEKITVIYHGIEMPSRQLQPPNFQLPGEYILYVGGRANFKNFLFFIRNFVAIEKLYPTLSVVCTGNPFTDEEHRFLEECNMQNKVYHISVSDIELSYLYSHALCFIYPSLYEGFGLPLLEAMSCGCPVLCSQSSCFPEIADNAALYFDPKSDNEIQKALNMIISNQSLRKDLITKGFSRVENFSWKLCAEQHTSFYEKVLG